MEATRFETLTSARHDVHPGPNFCAGNALLRTEALRQLHWQQRDWARILATHVTGTPCLVASTDRAGLNDGLDLLRAAGEEVPARLYRRGSLVRTMDAAGSIAAGVSLVSLLADITRVLEWFDAAHDHD
jgi:hypothetical protein